MAEVDPLRHRVMSKEKKKNYLILPNYSYIDFNLIFQTFRERQKKSHLSDFFLHGLQFDFLNILKIQAVFIIFDKIYAKIERMTNNFLKKRMEKKLISTIF